jgi:tetratricopeptide (TPR) repeat protein
LAILTWIALLSDCYAEAEDYSEQALSIAIAPQDRNTALIGKGSALALLRQIDAGMELLEAQRRRCVVDGDLYRLEGTDGPTAVCKILQGDIGGGIRLLEEAIARNETQGYRTSADWNRLTLCEVYLQIISGNEKLPFLSLLKNLPTVVKVMVIAPAPIRSLMARLLENPQIHPNGHFVGRAQMMLGLLCKIRKERALAIKHLSEAKRILSAFGETPIYARLNAALAELGQ